MISYLHYDDVAKAFDVILHKGVIGHLYNISMEMGMRVLDVATCLQAFQIETGEGCIVCTRYAF